MAQFFDLDEFFPTEADGMGLFHKKDSLIRRFVSNQRTRFREFRIRRQERKETARVTALPLTGEQFRTQAAAGPAPATKDGIFKRIIGAFRGTSVDFPAAGGAPVFTLPGGALSDIASLLPPQLQITTPFGPQPLGQAFDPQAQLARAGTQFSPILIIGAVVLGVFLLGGRGGRRRR